MKKKNLFFIIIPVIIIILYLFLSGSVPSLAQNDKGPPPGSDRDRFIMPTGKPVENPPDDEGRFRNPIVTTRKQSQLMNPGETYPPPEVKRFLLFLGIIALISFYWFFLKGQMHKLVPSVSGITRQIFSYTERVATKYVATHGRMTEADMVEEIAVQLEKDEKERQKKFGVFRSFSYKNVFGHLPNLDIYGIDSWQKGIHVFIVSSPHISRALALNLLHDISRHDMPVLFLSSRFTNEEIALGIIGIESNKPWFDMNEIERNRISRLVEEFLKKYNGLFNLSLLNLDERKILDMVIKVKAMGKINALIVDDFSFLVREKGQQFLNLLYLISTKEGFPIYIIDRNNDLYRESEIASRVSSILMVKSASDDSIEIKNTLKDKVGVWKLSINESTGKISPQVEG